MVLVDNMFHRNHADILAQAKTVTSQPLRYVINTHQHDDHAGGSFRMLPLAEVIAHRNVGVNLTDLKQPSYEDTPGTPHRGLPAVSAGGCAHRRARAIVKSGENAMPSRADALRFLSDPQTTRDRLQRACEILGVAATGSADDLRARAVAHIEAVAADADVVCLNPAPDAFAVVSAFNDAFNRHDVDAIMGLMTDDCVFENTRPAPDGTRYEGQGAVRAFWEQFFANSPQARFEFGDMFAAGNRCALVWTYHWVKNGTAGHVRGVDLFRIRDGKIAEKLSYVKG